MNTVKAHLFSVMSWLNPFTYSNNNSAGIAQDAAPNRSGSGTTLPWSPCEQQQATQVVQNITNNNFVNSGSGDFHYNPTTSESGVAASNASPNKRSYARMKDANGQEQLNNNETTPTGEVPKTNRSYEGADIDEVLQRFNENGLTLEQIKNLRLDSFDCIANERLPR